MKNRGGIPARAGYCSGTNSRDGNVNVSNTNWSVSSSEGTAEIHRRGFYLRFR